MNNLQTAIRHSRAANREIWVAVGLLGMAVLNNTRASDAMIREMNRQEEVKRSGPKAAPIHFDAESTAEEIH